MAILAVKTKELPITLTTVVHKRQRWRDGRDAKANKLCGVCIMWLIAKPWIEEDE